MVAVDASRADVRMGERPGKAPARPSMRLNVRCICGVMLAEMFMRENDRYETSRQLVLPCDHCRYIVFKFALDRRHPKNDLAVLHTIDLDTGRVIPGLAQIFLKADLKLRDGARGGTLLAPRMLLDTIARLEREHATGQTGQG